MVKSSVIEKTANEFRLKWGIGNNSATNLRSLLIKLNVSAYFKPMSGSFSGMAIKQGLHRFMLVNTSQNLGRQNFTTGHELYHLFVQENFIAETTYKAGAFNRFNEDEMKADLFSSFLLMPKDGILSLIPDDEFTQKGVSISLDTVVKLEQYFQVSRGAMLYRLKDLGYIDSAKYSEYSINVIKSARRRGFNDELYTSTQETDFISNYGDLANYLVETSKISDGDYFSLMMDIDVDILSNNYDNEVEI
jgi:Zn-dependent peptidase ImmA (M78 family)